jgi:zinc dependent phospholipase C
VARFVLLTLLITARISAYSVLTHEAIIDTVWDRSIKPVILSRYPKISADGLREAHAYTYGGAIIHDMGYYPFGSHLFSDLAHYVRCGDFVEFLIKDATNANELAFALGALAHYAADEYGHSTAVNFVVPMLYPKLKKKYGKVVTYEDSPSAHLKAEFAFDVVQVAQQHYAPNAYHDFIGFKVSKPLLERAFVQTYGFELKDVFMSVDLAIGTFRHTVSGLLPEMTKVAWETNKDEIMKASPGTTQQQFLFNLSRASYEKEWGNDYERPGIGARILAFFFRLIPRFGPFKALAFHEPTPEAQKLFMESFNETVANYRIRLSALLRHDRLQLPNDNLDTGKIMPFGAYKLADKAFAKLLGKLNDRQFEDVNAGLRKMVLSYYRGAKGLDPTISAQLAALSKN